MLGPIQSRNTTSIGPVGQDGERGASISALLELRFQEALNRISQHPDADPVRGEVVQILENYAQELFKTGEADLAFEQGPAVVAAERLAHHYEGQTGVNPSSLLDMTLWLRQALEAGARHG